MIKLEDVSKIYKIGERQIRALDSVSMELRKGDFISVIGPSGSGKSTLLHIMGLIDTPTYGKVIFDGTELYHRDGGGAKGIFGRIKRIFQRKNIGEKKLTRLRLKKIGFVFQQFYLLPTLTAIENVELPMKEAKVPKRKRRERAKKLLEEVGLGDRIDHYPRQMSGGEQQRVAIARALANNPEIILADEPTGEVDSKTSERIMEIFRELNEKEGITLVVVTHDPNVAKKASRVLRMRDGRIE